MEPGHAIEALVIFSRQIAEVTDPLSILTELSYAGADLVGADAVVVLQIRPNGTLTRVAEQGLPPELKSHIDHLDLLDSEVGEALVQASAGYFMGSTTHLLISGGGLYGAWTALYRQERPSPSRYHLACGLTDITALALDRAFQTDELVRTITQLEASRRELAQTEQLRVLGQMAAVVAHEVKNPLAGVSAGLQILQTRLEHGTQHGPERELIGKLLSRIRDLDGMVRDLLQFARPRQPALQPESVSELLDEAIDALRQDPVGRHLDLSVELNAEAQQAVIHIDRRLMLGVLLNLLLNAAQAVEGRGRVWLSARHQAGRCTLEVRDNGPGIPDEIRPRIFEPFFTTKTRGSGLGLAMAKRTVESHSGTLSLHCPQTGGTVATLEMTCLLLPAEPCPARS